MLRQERSATKCADEGKKFRCRDYVIIGDPAKELKKISLDEFYKNFTGVLLLMTPTSEFKTGKQKQGSMVKRFLDLLWPQKKPFLLRHSQLGHPDHHRDRILDVQQDPDG